jgi:hypothetical protein
MALSDADVEKIASALEAKFEHKHCRFNGISIEDLQETITFCKHCNDLLSTSGNVILKTFLTLGATGLFFLLLWGIV